MKNIFKKTVTIFLMLVAFGFVVNSYAANKGNIRDTDYNFNFPDFSIERYTNAREKWDASPSYLYVDEITRGREMLVRVVFSDYTFSTYAPKVYASSDNRICCLSSDSYENRGRCYVRIRADRQGHKAMYAKGWWSPDSSTCKWYN